MDDGDEGEGKGVYVDWEDGGQQKGVRGWWFGVDEFRSGETGGRNNGLVVSGLLCWRRESDDEVEREEGRRWVWRMRMGRGSGLLGFQGFGKGVREMGKKTTRKGRGGGFQWAGPAKPASPVHWTGLALIFFLPWPVFIAFGPVLQPLKILPFFSLFPPFKPIFRIYSKSAK